MKQESMDSLSPQTVAPVPESSTAENERDIMFQEQQRLIQANQLMIEELRQTMTTTHLLIEKNRVLVIQCKQSREKCK